MKYVQIAAVAAFAGLANAQSQCASDVQSIPACALGYIASDAYYKYGCDIIDFQCQCSNFMGLVNDVAPDVGNNPVCGADLGAVLDGAQSLCGCATSNSDQPSITLNAIESQCQPSAVAIPACGLGYIADAANSMFQCDIQDFACQCSNFDALNSAVVGDVSSACGDTATDVIQSASALCACVSGSGSTGGSGSTSATTTAVGSVSTSESSASPSGPGSTVASATPTVGGSSSKSSGTSAVSGGSSSEASGTSAVSGGSSKASGTAVSGGSSTKASGTAVGSGSSSAHITAGTTPAVSRQSGSQASGTIPMPTFTGAGATVSAFGGVMALVGGLVAFL